ncbi:VWA domain-containing protein [Gordonia sp. NPDC003585]|uniref:vWA domain-containing protein n=1 Tax=Gordonia sp. NPDC003585 TaxID=3154275 RepID=UPI0033B39895
MPARRRQIIRNRALPILWLTVVAALLLAGCSVDGTPTKETDQQVQPNPVPTMVVLDASDSMNTADAPGPRLDAAKAAVTSLAGGLPAGTPFGVVAFGSQKVARETTQTVGCADVRTVVPLGPLNTTALQGALNGLEAKGYTPIALALQQADEQLPASGPASIVLVSDGESTCQPPPCETAAAIHQQRPDVTISAVGFRTDDPSLACIAEKGGGLFVTADNAAQLSARLAAAQNAQAATTRLTPTSRGGITIGQSLSDVRAANPSFPTSGRTDGDRTIYRWIDCDYAFVDDVLVEIAPGDPPGSAGTTIDGVSSGTPGSRAVELYGEPLEDSDNVAVFTADQAAGTAYRIGYEGGDTIADGTVTTVILCHCLPSKKSSDGGPEVVKVIAVDQSGNPINGFAVTGSTQSWDSSTIGYCSNAIGAITLGVYHCGSTADSASVCWPSQGRLLCAYSPFKTELTAYSYSGTLPSLDQPDPDVSPWGLELANGARCVKVLGGAFPQGPVGYLYSYSCASGSDYTFVFVPTDSKQLFDKSGSTWTVTYGESDSVPTQVAVTKAYYSAAQ